MPAAATPRPYRSDLRERQAKETRAAILDAAERLFTAQGYARTRLADVAAEAGVALATVKLDFGTKPELLLELWHRTLARGVDDQVPVAERPWYREVFELARPADKLLHLAAIATMVRTRVAKVAEVLDTAAALDDEVAELQSRMASEFYANQREVVEHLHSGGFLRSGLTVDEATDVLVAINHRRVYSWLVVERGWINDRYTAWLADALQRELLEPQHWSERLVGEAFALP